MNPINLKNNFLILLFLVNLNVHAQKIEYRNDSLFVQNTFVDAQTSKITLDSLLNSKGKKKKSKGKPPRCNNAKKKQKETTYFYEDIGMSFTKYECDSSQLTVKIQLYKDSNRKYYIRKEELKNTFQGQLIIAENILNGKREINELEQLKNCKVSILNMTVGSRNILLGADLIYKENVIRLSFDNNSNLLKNVFIHHNFKER